MEKKEERYKRKIKALKKEILMLELFLFGAQPEAWDLDGLYEDAINSRDEYTGNYCESNLEFAKWLKKRYNLKKEVRNSSQA